MDFTPAVSKLQKYTPLLKRAPSKLKVCLPAGSQPFANSASSRPLISYIFSETSPASPNSKPTTVDRLKGLGLALSAGWYPTTDCRVNEDTDSSQP